MKQKTWKNYLGWIVLTEAVGALAEWLTMDGEKAFMATTQQPPLAPPSVTFPIVWGVLYALMGIGAARVQLAPAGKARTVALWAFGVQLAFNFVWSLIFFNLQAFALALFWMVVLWGLILWMVIAFWRVERWAGALQVPYLLWVAFAVYLNYGIWRLNP